MATGGGVITQPYCWWLLLVLLLQGIADGRNIRSSQLPSLHRSFPIKGGVRSQHFRHDQYTALPHVFSLRGGAHENKKTIGRTISSAINDITPTTRVYLFGCLAMALLTLCGIPEELLLFEPRRTFLKGQLWRPFTSSCFLGKVDMSMMSQIYFLVSYGQEMERQDGSAQFGYFLFIQMMLLMMLSSMIGYPSLSRSLIAASIYTCSRRDPSRMMEIQFGLRIEYWLLPYINLFIECLQAQSLAAALPHVLGILTGHVYHFYAFIWPKMGGRNLMKVPGVIESLYRLKAKKKATSSAPKWADIFKRSKEVSSKDEGEMPGGTMLTPIHHSETPNVEIDKEAAKLKTFKVSKRRKAKAKEKVKVCGTTKTSTKASDENKNLDSSRLRRNSKSIKSKKAKRK